MRAARTWWAIAFAVAMIPLMGTLEFLFGRSFWVGAIGGSVVGAAFWFSYWLRRRRPPQPLVTAERQASTGEDEHATGEHG